MQEINFYVILALLIVGSIAKAIMDVLQFHYSDSIFGKLKKASLIKWFNPLISCNNKWKDGNPANGESFLGSSTVFVSLTDAWHFFQHIMLFCFMASIVLYKSFFGIFIDFGIFYILFTCVFELFYSKIFRIKK
jgi:hypothetical protein